MTSNPCGKGNGLGACFIPPVWPFTDGTIWSGPAFSIQTDVWEHEYGHFITWTYGDLNYSCTANYEEGKVLAEAWANLFGEVSAVMDGSLNPDYGALKKFDNTGAPAAENTTTVFNTPPSFYLQFHFVDCGADPHTQERPLEQAIWELLFNRNCDAFDGFATCTDSLGFYTGTINAVFPGSSQSSVAVLIARAEAYAMQQDPYYNSTVVDTELYFGDYLKAHTSAQDYTNVVYLFGKHNLNYMP